MRGVRHGGSARRVGADVVSLDRRVGHSAEINAVGVAGDHVAFAGHRATNLRARGSAVQVDASYAIADGGGPGRVDADIVADDDGPGKSTLADKNAFLGVAGNDIASGGGDPANRVVARTVGDKDAVPGISGRGHAGGVGADVVAGDKILPAVFQENAVAAEVVDRQTANDGVAGRNIQTVKIEHTSLAHNVDER